MQVHAPNRVVSALRHSVEFLTKIGMLTKRARPTTAARQVRYVHEAMRRLRPGVPLRALHGKMKQQKRLAAFYEFCEVREILNPKTLPDDQTPSVVGKPSNWFKCSPRLYTFGEHLCSWDASRPQTGLACQRCYARLTLRPSYR